MKHSLFLLCFCLSSVVVVAGGKGKKKVIQQLQTDITFLASDSLEGRRMGTEGERIAAQYIEQRFRSLGLKPLFSEGFQQRFTVVQGKRLSEQTGCVINEKPLLAEDFVPLPFTAFTTVNQIIVPKIKESNVPVFIAASKVSDKSLSNPHADALSDYQARAAKEFANGASAVIFYNDKGSDFDFEYSSGNIADTTFSGLCLFINSKASKEHIIPVLSTEMFSLDATVALVDNLRDGINVAGFYNNGAAKTIVIGAHYDHLGYGEDHNSLHTGEPAIHNGADDNASGVAGVFALAAQVKKFNKRYNYLFVTFSGEELGLFGSKKFLELNPSLVPQINCMINMDMMGRFDTKKNRITVGGVGTSPTWIPVIEAVKHSFQISYDSSGVGPSDHTSFYLKDKPVLFFFTGLHSDYHKPSDDADKINYVGEAMLIDYIAEVIKKISAQPPLSFTKTVEKKIEGVRFKVTLGIMPDYTFSGAGVRADGISQGKLADKIGMATGDIIISLGDYRVVDMESYMKALSKFSKGQSTKVGFMRDDVFMEKELTFE